MSVITEYMKTHRTPEIFDCSCGAKVNLQMWVEDGRILVCYAHCWKCRKEMTRNDDVSVIKLAKFNVIDYIVAHFKRDFNSDEKPKPIRVVK